MKKQAFINLLVPYGAIVTLLLLIKARISMSKRPLARENTPPISVILPFVSMLLSKNGNGYNKPNCFNASHINRFALTLSFLSFKQIKCQFFFEAI